VISLFSPVVFLWLLFSRSPLHGPLSQIVRQTLVNLFHVFFPCANSMALGFSPPFLPFLLKTIIFFHRFLKII